MRCPFCSSEDTQVKDSRQAEDNSAVRRRRQCGSCGARFTTFERVQLRDLTVVKKSGRRTPFDRDKLARSVWIAMQKRPVQPDQVEDKIAYVRYASVYKDFRATEDFASFITEERLSSEEDE